jgi:uncharacterized protein (TIGR02996 family)
VVAGPQSEDAFLNAIAARPDDGALRRVFCDWLLEQGDPRGDVMVLALQPQLSSADRRRLERLTKAHAHKWLGPLAPAVLGAHEDDEVDGLQARFEGGLLEHVAFRPMSTAEWKLLVGEPRLATVKSAVFSDARGQPPAEFLCHRVLASLTHVECGAAMLDIAHALPFAPLWLRIHTSKHKSDLAVLAGFKGMSSVKELVLSIHNSNPKAVGLRAQNAEPLIDELLDSPAVFQREHFELDFSNATVEGIAEAILFGTTQLRRMRQRVLQRFTVRYRDTPFTLHGDQLQFLEIDPSSREGEWTVDSRFAAAAAVIAQLSGVALQSIDVKAPPGGRVTRQELDALRAAARRLRSLESLVVAGNKQPP